MRPTTPWPPTGGSPSPCGPVVIDWANPAVERCLAAWSDETSVRSHGLRHWKKCFEVDSGDAEGRSVAAGRRRTLRAEAAELGGRPTVEPRAAVKTVRAATEAVRAAMAGVGAAVVQSPGCIVGSSGGVSAGPGFTHAALTCMHGGSRCMREGWRSMRAPWRCMPAARGSARAARRVSGRALGVIVPGPDPGDGDAGIHRAVWKHARADRCDVDRGGRWSAQGSGRLTRHWSPLKGLLRVRACERECERSTDHRR